MFGLISSFLINRRGSQNLHKEMQLMLDFLMTSFLLYINDLPDDFICNVAIYVYDTTLYSDCEQVSDLWQQLEFSSELESDLQDTMGWGQEVTC